MDESPPPAEPFVPLRLSIPADGLSVELNKPDVVLGRHSAADVRVGLPDVSRRHCRFVFADNRWQVFDLNSLNGLFVNGERVQQACGNDYRAHCGEYGIETSALRLCMRKVGQQLSNACVNALVADGQVSRAEVERRKREGR